MIVSILSAFIVHKKAKTQGKIVLQFFGKNTYFDAIWITICTFLEQFKISKFLHLKAN